MAQERGAGGGASGRAGAAALDVAVRGAVAWGLHAGLLAFSAWAGHAALHGGPWVETDLALFRTLNRMEVAPLTHALYALLNDPGPAYLVVIVALLGYCALRRRERLPAAALAIGVALALGQVATHRMHHAGARERPFVADADARTPIASCAGPVMITRRGANGPTAACDGSPAQLVGRDWRTIWTQFPSFPSGHLRETGALVVLLVGFWPRAWPYALGYLLLMAFSRVHLGAHYPTDVAAGLAAGAWAGGTTLFGLDLLRRLGRLLLGVPALRGAWEWVARSREPGRPDLDPLGARLLRAAAAVAAALAALYALGFTVVTGGAGQLFTVLQSTDDSLYGSVTTRFSAGAAPALYYLLGPAGLVYAALAAAALVVAWGMGGAGRARALAFGAATLVASVALALLLQAVGSAWFQRPQPFTQIPETPVPEEWRAAWRAATSFPSGHVLLVAALAALLRPGARAIAAGQAVALGAVAAAVYFGAAWLSDALSSYALGMGAAAAARYAVRQFLPEPRDGAPARVNQS